MDKEYGTVATEVLRLLKTEYKKSINRVYGVLIIVIVLFVVSIVDSIYQRCRIIKVVEDHNKHCVQAITEYAAHYDGWVTYAKTKLFKT